MASRGILTTQRRLNQRAEASDTFSPNVISLSRDHYEKMVMGMQLPLRAIETSTVVGPFFWWICDEEAANPVIRECDAW